EQSKSPHSHGLKNVSTVIVEFHICSKDLQVFLDILDLISSIPIPGNEGNLSDLAPGGKRGLLINKNDYIHSLCYQPLLRSARRFSDKAFQPDQTTNGVVGMHGGRAAGMPCIPGFQHRVSLSTPNLANDDAGRL